MSVTAVQKLHEKLKTAINKKDEDEILQVLEDLTPLKISLQILQLTEIGKTVGKLRKQYPDSKICSKSALLVTSWKSAIQVSSPPTKTKSVAPVAQTEQKRTKTESNEKKSVTAAVSSPTSGDMRERTAKLLLEALQAKKKDYDDFSFAKQLEAELFTEYEGATANYRTRLRALILNIKDPKNADFSGRIFEGELDAHTLAVMPVEMMASKERQEEKKFEQEWATEACKERQQGVTSTDMFKCGKCGSRETTYYQMQTRSADEPMTTFHQCVKCGNRWKS